MTPQSGLRTTIVDVPTSSWKHCLEHAALSDLGRRRANNQDSYVTVLAGNQADFQRRGHFFMVADGMGAHAAGELASKMAIDAVSLDYRKRPEQAAAEAILSAVLDANRQIHTRGLASPDFRGMGTTATALLLLPTGALVAHVGDSRAYRLRGTRLDQLTFDHSLVWEIRAAGHTLDTELPGYISKNIITRSLGPSPTVQVDLEGPYPVEAGDTVLLCSDGLSGQLSDEEIGMVLGCLPPTEAARALVDLANLRGGPDNITVVIARVLGPQIAESTTPEPSPKAGAASVRPIHPVVWTVMGVAFLSALGLFALGHLLVALTALLSAAAAVVAAILQRYGGADRRRLEEGRRFGRGPYVTCDCAPGAPLLGQLTDFIQQLRDTCEKEKLSVDLASLDGFLHRAVAAVEAGNLSEAAREYLRVIIFLMDHRREPRVASSDSGIIVF